MAEAIVGTAGGPDGGFGSESAQQTIRRQQRMISALMSEKNEPIAIVGAAIKLPGGNTELPVFAEFLRDGRSATGPIPADRWDAEAFRPDGARTRGTISTSGGGFISGIDQFDPRFFSISPKEADYIDPQQRLVLEAAWQALESANLDTGPLRGGNGGVYMGVSCVDYALEVDALGYEELDAHIGTGSAHSAVAGRVSYFLGWRGPSMAVDTACSSSLVALHLAAAGLRRRECDIALCGGVNVIHHPRNHIIFSDAHMLAPDGRCKTFDDKADGYSRSEGCGALVLKRLSDAVRDGDTVLALVRGTAVGQDGESGGLTVPNGTAQEAVMRAAVSASMLEPGAIGYVEAHGTGTSLGDPIEMGAIQAVFGSSRDRSDPVLVGSVKTNLGHMEPAAGIGGVVKALLQLREGRIYPHINFDTPSRHIPWDTYSVAVPTECRSWPGRPGQPRRAIVNSFGFQGTLATVVLEQAPPAEPEPLPAPGRPEATQSTSDLSRPDRSMRDQATSDASVPARSTSDQPAAEVSVLTLSARSSGSLRALVERYRRHLTEQPDLAASDVCYTTNVGRTHFPVRVAGAVGDREELIGLLDRQLAKLADAGDGAAGFRGRKVAFLFTGQGSQYPGMGRELYRDFPVFRAHLDECDQLFQPYLGRSIKAMMLNGGEEPAGGEHGAEERSAGEHGAGDYGAGDYGAGEAGELAQTGFAQPALFSLEYALARLWMSWGVRPNVLLGHSIGEVVAATVAGLFSLADAVTLVAARARLMQAVCTPGGMVAVTAAVPDVADLLDGHGDLAVAAVNAPRQCVLSGAAQALAEVTDRLRERGVRVKPMRVSHAFHSPLMTEVFDAFRAALSGIRWREPELTFISDVTGEPAKLAEVSTPDYWVRHIGAPVNFLAGMRAIERRGKHIFLEVGPGAALVGLGKQCVTAADHEWLSSLHPTDTHGRVVRAAAARLYTAGVNLAWAAFHASRPKRKVVLPSYAFERRRHWLPVDGRRRVPGGGVAAGPVGHPLLGQEKSTAEQRLGGVREFAATISADAPAYLADHVVAGQVVFPGTGYVEILLALQDAVFGETARPLRDIRIHEPLLLSGEPVEVRTRLRLAENTAEIVSRMPGAGTDAAIERRHATARLDRSPDLPTELRDLISELSAVDGKETVYPADEFYARLADLGLAYGPEFQRVRTAVRYRSMLAGAELAGLDTQVPEHLPPSILDCAMQALVVAADGEETYLPVEFGCGQLLKKPKGDLRSVVRLRPPTRRAQPEPGFGGGGHAPSSSGRAQPEPGFGGGEHALSSSADTGLDLVADVVLLEGDRPVFVLAGLGCKRVAGSAADGRRMVHEPRWMKRSLPPARPGTRAPRRIVVVNRTAADFSAVDERLAQAGVQLAFAADPAHAEELLSGQPEATDLCWFWREEDGLAGADRLREESERNYRDLLALTGALDSGPAAAPRVWLVTEAAQWLPDDTVDGSDPDRLAAASLWGFGQVLRTEYPRHRVTLVDLPPGTGPGGAEGVLTSAKTRLRLRSAEGPEGVLTSAKARLRLRSPGDYHHLVDEWLASDGGAGEPQVAYRASGRHVKRIAGRAPGPADDANAELVIKEYGQFSAVQLAGCQDEPPQDDEIQVRVHAAGLNFKDVLNALGLLRQYAQDAGIAYRELPLGFEGAGTVLAAGPRARFQPGDEVIFCAQGSMRRRVTIPSAVAVGKPAALSFAEAGGLASAYLTAYYALHGLAKIGKGDRVLIHAAAGGVGQAAVALARLAGAEVYATASPAKWPLLRAQGVRHIFNSRTLDFAGGVAEHTAGQGVDIVLNSLNKEYIPASMRVLGAGGRFVELGKIGVWSAERVRAERPDVAYHNFDMSEFAADELTQLTGQILSAVVGHVAKGELAPLPTTAYRLDEVAEAFGVLSRGANVGKLVLSFVDDRAPVTRPVRISPDETYLITGGAGALGMVAARKLVELGARHLVLLNRRELSGKDLRFGDGVQITAYRGDVADPGDMDRLLAVLRRGPHPLGGIIHTAGVLADAPVTGLSWEKIDAVFRPKVYGGWLLHRAAADLPGLRFFVAYSSVSSVLGTAGQANYAAANAYLDELMRWRAGHGLPGLSVGWGPWAGAGMAARLDERLAKGIERQGITPLRPVTAMRALLDVLDRPVAHTMIGEFDWSRFAAGQAADNPLYDLVAASGTRARASIDLAAVRARPAPERHAAISDFVRAKIGEVLHFDGADDVDPDARFNELGLDSLVAVELKNGLEAAFGLPLPASLAFDYPSIPLLVEFLDQRLTPDATPAAPGTPDFPPDGPDAGVRELTDDEAYAQLAALKESW